MSGGKKPSTFGNLSSVVLMSVLVLTIRLLLPWEYYTKSSSDRQTTVPNFFSCFSVPYLYKYLAIKYALELGVVERTVCEDRLGARTPPAGEWRGGCEGGAARDDSIAPHPRRRRPPRVPRRPALSAGAGARRPLRQPRARREARPISGNKRKGRAKTRGRRSGRG